MHVAIIPDGNRRWARAKMLAPFEGHRAGSRVTDAMISTCIERGVGWITVWGSSVDNMTKRPKEEVQFLDQLTVDRLRELMVNPTIHRHHIRIKVIGEWVKYFSAEAQNAIHAVMGITGAYTDRTLTILLAYDGLRETEAAIQKIIGMAHIPRVGPAPTNIELLRQHLITKDLPPVDLLIRTGGEPHWSAGFLLWQTSNTQLVFPDKLWPDMTPADFAAAIEEYHRRQRRFGA